MNPASSRTKKQFALLFCAAVCLLVSSWVASAQTLDLAHYSTRVRVADDIQVALYTPTMFRITFSKLEGEKFPIKYEIPFVIGRLRDWPTVEEKHWSDADYGYVQTERLTLRVSLHDHTWTVRSRADDKPIYPSNGPIYGMFRDGYALFDSAAVQDQRTDYSRYSHWFYDPQTKRYVDIYISGDLLFDQFFIYGPDYPSLFQQLNDLVGPEPLLPKKAYGFFQTQHLGCKGSQSKLMDVAERLRRDHIPTDTLIIDYEWGDGCPGGDESDEHWGQLGWSPNYRSPLTPQQMLAKLHDMHFDVMVIHHSVPEFPNRDEYVQRERSREWESKVVPADEWWAKLKDLLDVGVNGTWQDTRKNDLTDSVIWQGLQNYYGPSQRVLFMGNRNMVEVDPWGLERDERGSSNSLLASRRYPFRWTGDAQTTWSELRWEIDAITNTYGAMDGVSYITADAFGADWKQQARWNQFMAFAPVARSHTMKPWDVKLDTKSLGGIMAFGANRAVPPTDFNEPAAAQIGAATQDKLHPAETAEASIRKNLTMRYRILPYIYSEAFHHYLTGFPIARPMVLAFPTDAHCKFNRWPYQYMLGDSFLVAPVWADMQTMEIYLPEGTDWIDYNTKATYRGGQVINYDTSDVTTLPLFVKSGSIIPMRPDSEWIDPNDHDTSVTLDIYPAKVPSTYTLYEDDNKSTSYQSGKYATTIIDTHIDENSEILTHISASAGDYSGKPASRTYRLDFNFVASSPLKVLVDDREIGNQSATSYSSALTSWSYDAARHIVSVSIRQDTDEPLNIRIVTAGTAEPNKNSAT